MSNGLLIAIFCVCFVLVAILAIITEFDIKYLFRKKKKNNNLPYSKMPPTEAINRSLRVANTIKDIFPYIGMWGY